MKKEDIKLWDWERILFGQAPAEFMLEVLLRTLIVYLVTLVVMRKIGKRMNGQLTITEMAVMLMIGATISVPMQVPDRGILQGLLVLFCILLLLRSINLWAFNNKRIERLTQGDVTLLVKDGVLVLDQMKKDRVSKQQLYAALRHQNVFHLGKVKRLYFEACGMFNLYIQEEKRPGLPIFPPDDAGILQSQQTAPNSEKACCNCGLVQAVPDIKQRCTNCGHSEWANAIIG